MIFMCGASSVLARGDDEFSTDMDEFKQFEGGKNVVDFEAEEKEMLALKKTRVLTMTAVVFLMTAFAGVLVRFPQTRRYRPFVLVASLVYFGFVSGGCPCMISSFIDILLTVVGVADRHWYDFLWLLGLIPLTYVFGRVWCGWVCHLGALQELLFKRDVFKALRNKRTTRILVWTRRVLLVALIAQLLITRTNEWCDIDPFIVAFNLRSANMTGWVLIGLLLILSAMIHRPFCRGACPVGLMLGAISRIPGASKLLILSPAANDARSVSSQSSCAGCLICSDICAGRAISRESQKDGEVQVSLDSSACNYCGDCLNLCSLTAIRPVRTSKRGKVS